MTWRIPGAKPWVQTTVGLLQTADWEEGAACGVMKYDDGTLWYWNAEMAHTANDDYVEQVVVNEFVPGSDAWENLSPDMFNDLDYNEDQPSFGTMIDNPIMQKYAFVAHDGGDKAFWFPPNTIYNSSVSYQRSVFVTHKDTRAIDHRVIGIGGSWFIVAAPVIYDGYVWYLVKENGHYSNPVVTILFRMSMDTPYESVEVKRWTYNESATSTAHVNWLNTTDPDTGVARWFSLPYAPYVDDSALGVSDDGYLYISEMQRQDTWVDGAWQRRGHSWIRRMKLPDGEWTTLYHYTADNYWPVTYNLPDGTINDDGRGPLPIGIGLRPNWFGSSIKIRDGWLYYVDAGTSHSMLTQGWTGGHMFCRIRLSDIEGGWAEHNPENPIIEVLSMTTGPDDTFYTWTDRITGYGVSWRDGINSVHAFIENQWFFDDDGSIMFAHHEYPSWYMLPGDWYPPHVLSRLSPPENLPITFNLVFEGEEMKGYGHVRDVPAKTKIGTIELSGE